MSVASSLAFVTTPGLPSCPETVKHGIDSFFLRFTGPLFQRPSLVHPSVVSIVDAANSVNPRQANSYLSSFDIRESGKKKRTLVTPGPSLTQTTVLPLPTRTPGSSAWRPCPANPGGFCIGNADNKYGPDEIHDDEFQYLTDRLLVNFTIRVATVRYIGSAIAFF
jgi:hypothetical protein